MTIDIDALQKQKPPNLEGPYLWMCKGNAPYEPTNNIFGKAVENSKSQTILLERFIADHKHIQVQVLNIQKGIVWKR